MSLTRDQAGVLAENIHSKLGYLCRICDRMEKTGRKDDPLYRFVVAAHESLHSLWAHLHYRSCGIERPPQAGGG